MRVVDAVVFLMVGGLLLKVAYAVVMAATAGLYLRARGVRTRGTCQGVVAGRTGSGVAVRFDDPAGRAWTVRVFGWNGSRLPEAGAPVDIVYNRRDPRQADRWPVRTPNAIGNVFYLGLCGLIIAALGMGALWVAGLAAWSVVGT